MKTTTVLGLASLTTLMACAPTGEPVGETELALWAPAFQVAEKGCAMAHCDAQMSDAVGMPAPAGPVTTKWEDNGGYDRAEPSGSSIGLGCSSNGRVAACTYGGFADNLVVYRPNGSIVFRKNELGPLAWTSGPMVDEAGGVITADGTYIYRYGPFGVRYWRTRTPGGFPISPVMTDNGVVVLATKLGPISTYRSTDGRFLDELELGFDTENTPGVSGNRIYVSTSQGNYAKLVAVDVSATGTLSDAWGNQAFSYHPTSGASPAVRGDRIYFDGHDGAGVPHVFCVRDDGDRATEMWRYPMEGEVTASLALDPRGGVWTYAVNHSTLIHLDEQGDVEQTIDLDALVGGLLTYSPSSVMSIAGDADDPVMIVTARGNGTTVSQIAAVNLVSETLRWKEPIDPWTDTTAVQFPILLDHRNKPLVIAATWFGGAHAIGER